MLPRSLSRAIAKPSGLVLSAALALLLGACGGGGGSPGTVPGGSNSTVGLEPKASIAVLNAGGTAVTSVSGTLSVTVKVTLLDARGVPAPAEIVTFTSSSALVEFTSSALTDTAGVATISVKPINVNSAGAVAITATAVVAGKTDRDRQPGRRRCFADGWPVGIFAQPATHPAAGRLGFAAEYPCHHWRTASVRRARPGPHFPVHERRQRHPGGR